MKPLLLLSAVASLAATPTSAQLTQLAHDHFDDGALDPAWTVTLHQASGWTWTEAANGGGTQLEVQAIDGVPGGTWGGAWLEQPVSPTYLLDARLVAGWKDSHGMAQCQLDVLDEAGETIARVGYYDSWSPLVAGSWSAAVDDASAHGWSDHFSSAGTAEFRIDRSSTGLIRIYVNGGFVFSGLDHRAVTAIRLRLERHGSHVYAPVFSDHVTVYGDPCSGSALLDGTPTSVSVSSGGTQSFELATCPPAPAHWYLLLGSMSGTQPGIPADSVVLPLNWDVYLETSLKWANGPVFQNTFGALDDAGFATAAVSLPAGLNPALAGTTLNHAFVVFGPLGTAHLASGAEPLTLKP
jgi:hypothetical protein